MAEEEEEQRRGTDVEDVGLGSGLEGWRLRVWESAYSGACMSRLISCLFSVSCLFLFVTHFVFPKHILSTRSRISFAWQQHSV